MFIDTTYTGTDGQDAQVKIHLATDTERSLTDAALIKIAANQHLLRWEERNKIGTAYVTAKALRAASAPGATVRREGHVVTVLLPCFALLVSSN